MRREKTRSGKLKMELFHIGDVDDVRNISRGRFLTKTSYLSFLLYKTLGHAVFSP